MLSTEAESLLPAEHLTLLAMGWGSGKGYRAFHSLLLLLHPHSHMGAPHLSKGEQKAYDRFSSGYPEGQCIHSLASYSPDQ